MLAYLPFAADRLPSRPAGVRIEQFAAGDPIPKTAGEVEFYVADYPITVAAVNAARDFPKLVVLQTQTAGVDAVLPHLREGVILCNATGVHDASTSELAVGMMIAAQRRFADLVRAQDRGVWDFRESLALADSKVLVLGAGSIAHALEARLRPFEVEVTLVGRTAREGVAGIDQLPVLLPTADIVCLLVPLTAETRGMVDADFLARMKDNALLVNVARGPIVDTDALVAELATSRLRAALDVTDPEPLPPGHPLWTCPGLFLTPHVGGASAAMQPRSYQLIAEQLRRYSAGEPLLNVVQRTP